jgi:hypothetical protein
VSGVLVSARAHAASKNAISDAVIRRPYVSTRHAIVKSRCEVALDGTRSPFTAT